jgi:cysteine desulfuration protein SufE
MTATPANVGLPTLVDLADTFDVLDEWVERYKYLIDLGRELTPLTDAERVGQNKVVGCISQVWLVGDPPDSDHRMWFRADSDAHIVKGLIAVALVLFSGKTPAEILVTDPADVYERLGLNEHLSVNRRNGFVSMMQRIKEMAANRANAS